MSEEVDNDSGTSPDTGNQRFGYIEENECTMIHDEQIHSKTLLHCHILVEAIDMIERVKS